MSSVEKIKQLFAKSEVTANSKVNNRIIGDALMAFDKCEKIQSASSEQNIWRIIMKSRITKLASTTVIITGVFVGLYLFAGPIGVTSVSWADVLKNIEKARTVTYIFEIEKGNVKEVFKTSIKEPYLCRSDVIESPYTYKTAIRNAKNNKRMTLYPNTKMAVTNDDEGSPGDEIHAYEGLKRDFRDGTCRCCNTGITCQCINVFSH